MIQYLAFRLYAPASAWGNELTGLERSFVDRHPRRSALLGLLGAALGIKRPDDDGHRALSESVRFAVVSHGPRDVHRDFRTVQTIESGKGRNAITFATRRDALTHEHKKIHTQTSWREYVTDGIWRVFVSSTGGPIALDIVHGVLKRPTFGLYLGRRENPPALPLDAQLIESADLTNAISDYPALPTLDAAKYPILAGACDTLNRRVISSHPTVLSWDAGFPGAPEPQETRTVRAQPLSRRLWRFDLTIEHACRMEPVSQQGES